MRQRVIVTGHKSPDTDSICSALGYAFYKNRTDPSRAYLAVRAGELNDETRFVLERFGFRVPPLLRSLMPQVQDIPRKRLVTVSPSTRVGKAAILMKENHIHSLPVVDDALVVRGVVDAVDIATAYADQLEHADVLPYAVELDTLVRQLSARIVVRTQEFTDIRGRLLVVTGSVERLAPGAEDVAIIISDGVPAGDVLAACSAASTLIVTGRAASTETQAQWPDHLNLVLETDMTVTQALRTLWSAIPVSAFMEGTVPLLGMTDTLERAKKAVLDSSARCAVVLDAQHHLVNIVTRSDLIRFARKKVILVDHNETLQAVDGVEEADILEIIDHHRVGDISTFRPIYFHNEPVGSTCTIVAELCAENGVFLPKSVAGVLLSGVLSDTMNLNLSTTTPKDVRAVRRLAATIGIDAEVYGLELLQNGSVMFKGLSAIEVLMRDFKEFDLFDTRIGISQAVVFSFDRIRERESEFKQAMWDVRARMGLAMVAFLATDPLSRRSYLIVAGPADAFEEAFGVHMEDGHAVLDGVLSRKKDFIPPVAEALSRYA
ncbi:MAG: putative manganese-dependent inorganic diphosphatase [Caldiserica bacterium]|nr:putative manganese-dependent inorganic diphosphatase [Caldisericota bacterium]